MKKYQTNKNELDTCIDNHRSLSLSTTKPQPYRCKDNKSSYSFKEDEERPSDEVIWSQWIPIHGHDVVGKIHGHQATQCHRQGENDKGHPGKGSTASCKTLNQSHRPTLPCCHCKLALIGPSCS